MHKVTNIPVVLINPLLTCKLCGGYLIDATTIVECLHSFCRSCILAHLELHATCPICDTLLHKTRPHYAIRPDRALQAIVYKLIPDLFEKEMACRRQFYKDHPCPEVRSLSPEKRGDITMSTYFIQEEEHISIELAYWQPDNKEPPPVLSALDNPVSDHRSTFLLCPPDLTVGHLEKLIRIKFELKPIEHEVALFFSSDDLFNFDYTLSDLACLYSWRSHQPMKVYFTIIQQNRSAMITDCQTNSAKCNNTVVEDFQRAKSFPSVNSRPNVPSFASTHSTSTKTTFLTSSDSNSPSRSSRFNRSDFPNGGGSKLRDSYFIDSWNRSLQYPYTDSRFTKQVPSKHSIDPVALSPNSLSSVNSATSVCSPRA